MGIKRGGSRAYVGEQRIFAGSLPAFGWLESDGGLYDGAAYPALYAEIGTAYNVGGEPAGFFRVPDKRGRGSIGRGQGSGLTNRTKGQRLGAESVVLSVSQIPSHSHSTSAGLADSTDGIAPYFDSADSASGGTITIGANGGGGSHTNMQPVEVDIWGIKF